MNQSLSSICIVTSDIKKQGCLDKAYWLSNYFKNFRSLLEKLGQFSYITLEEDCKGKLIILPCTKCFPTYKEIINYLKNDSMLIIIYGRFGDISDTENNYFPRDKKFIEFKALTKQNLMERKYYLKVFSSEKGVIFKSKRNIKKIESYPLYLIEELKDNIKANKISDFLTISLEDNTGKSFTLGKCYSTETGGKVFLLPEMMLYNDVFSITDKNNIKFSNILYDIFKNTMYSDRNKKKEEGLPFSLIFKLEKKSKKKINSETGVYEVGEIAYAKCYFKVYNVKKLENILSNDNVDIYIGKKIENALPDGTHFNQTSNLKCVYDKKENTLTFQSDAISIKKLMMKSKKYQIIKIKDRSYSFKFIKEKIDIPFNPKLRIYREDKVKGIVEEVPIETNPESISVVSKNKMRNKYIRETLVSLSILKQNYQICVLSEVLEKSVEKIEQFANKIGEHYANIIKNLCDLKVSEESGHYDDFIDFTVKKSKEITENFLLNLRDLVKKTNSSEKINTLLGVYWRYVLHELHLFMHSKLFNSRKIDKDYFASYLQLILFFYCELKKIIDKVRKISEKESSATPSLKKFTKRLRDISRNIRNRLKCVYEVFSDVILFLPPTDC